MVGERGARNAVSWPEALVKIAPFWAPMEVADKADVVPSSQIDNRAFTRCGGWAMRRSTDSACSLGGLYKQVADMVRHSLFSPELTSTVGPAWTASGPVATWSVSTAQDMQCHGPKRWLKARPVRWLCVGYNWFLNMEAKQRYIFDTKCTLSGKEIC